MSTWTYRRARRSRHQGGFTLVELVIASAIAAMTIGGIIYGFVMSAQMAEWSSYHLAAHSLAIQRLEQARAAKWDIAANPDVDELVSSNFPMVVEILDIPRQGTNYVYATNWTTITTISTSPALKMIQVDCTWRFGTGKIFTNTVATYRGAD